jgi:hypothetical protein
MYIAFVVGYFSDLTSTSAKAFLTVADTTDAYPFTITSSADIKTKLALTTDTIVILKTFDELRNELVVSGASLDVEATQAFVLEGCTPLIQTFSETNSRKIFSSPIKVNTFKYIVNIQYIIYILYIYIVVCYVNPYINI